MKKHADSEPKQDEEVILLEDLAPRKDVKGGAGKILFGEDIVAGPVEEPPDEPTASKKGAPRP
jgi:hypothetical protein